MIRESNFSPKVLLQMSYLLLPRVAPGEPKVLFLLLDTEPLGAVDGP